MLHYLNAQSLSRDSTVRLGSLHQKIFPFSPRPQSDCLQQSFTIRHHISSVIMQQHFHTYSFVTLIVLWLPETLTLISKCIVKNQLPRSNTRACNSQKETGKFYVFSWWPQLYGFRAYYIPHVNMKGRDAQRRNCPCVIHCKDIKVKSSSSSPRKPLPRQKS